MAYQVRFLNAVWNGKEYDVFGNFRTFDTYPDACHCLDNIGDHVFADLKSKTTGNVECAEIRDEKTDLLSSIEFFTTNAERPINNVCGEVVALNIEDEYKYSKPYKVELLYQIRRVVEVMADSPDDALDKAMEMPLTRANLDQATLEDSYVEVIKH